MVDLDAVHEVLRPGQQAWLRDQRPSPRVERPGVAPLLEEDDILTVGIHLPGELRVHEAGLLAEDGKLLAEPRVEGGSTIGPYPGREHPHDHGLMVRQVIPARNPHPASATRSRVLLMSNYARAMTILRMDNVGIVVDDLKAAIAFVVELGLELEGEFAVDDIEDVLARLQAHGAELVGEVVQYEDNYLLCYVRGPAGIIVALAEQLSGRSA